MAETFEDDTFIISTIITSLQGDYIKILFFLQKEEIMDRSKLCIIVDEAAELASVAPAVIRQWAEDFDFPSMKIGQRGGKRLIHLDSFNAWLAKRCQARIGE